MTNHIKKGDYVVLEQAPDGCISQYYNVTVGRRYQVKDLMGSCLVVDEDDGAGTASIWRGRFRKSEGAEIHCRSLAV